MKFGVHDLLAAVETVVPRESVAKRNGEQVIRHCLKPKELKTDKER